MVEPTVKQVMHVHWILLLRSWLPKLEQSITHEVPFLLFLIYSPTAAEGRTVLSSKNIVLNPQACFLFMIPCPHRPVHF